MSTRIALLAVPDALVVVAQTPSAPSLGEASGARATSEPMIVVSDGNEICNPDPNACPGDLFLVTTNVLARAWAGLPSTTQPKLSEDTATQFKTTVVKVMVSSCDGNSRRIIDPGYPIVVRGPKARIAVLAPGSAADVDRPALQRLDGEGPAQLEEAWEIAIFATACPLRCYSPPLPQLTYWYAYEGAADLTTFIFTVPRGARRLVIADLDAAITELQFWQGQPGTAASVQIGTQALVPAPAGAVDIPIFGSPTHIFFLGTPDNPGELLMRWEID